MVPKKEKSRDDLASFVFISHASGDLAAAQDVCSALEADGQRCWIAPRDVNAGEPYAGAILEAINACRLMVLILTRSAIESSHVHREVERASSKDRTVLAVRLDAHPLPPDLEYFLSSQHWLDATNGSLQDVMPALVASVQGRSRDMPPHPRTTQLPQRSSRAAKAGIALGALALILAGAIVVWDRQASPTSGVGVAASAPPAPTAALPAFPPRSVAVLPFVNQSGDPAQEYFSDGLSEELLNSLTTVRDLQVAARTSSFSFKGSKEPVGDIARKLNVGAVLEGSVRRDGDRVRITVQLVDATSGFNRWSQSYERNLGNVLALQTEIAVAVTRELQATLLSDAAAVIELGGTHNPAAFDAYLRARYLLRGVWGRDTMQQAMDLFRTAARIDPDYAKAHAGLAQALIWMGNYFSATEERRVLRADAQNAAVQAVALAPQLGLAHSSLAAVLASKFEFLDAHREYEKAVELAPSDAEVLAAAGEFEVNMGNMAGLTLLHRAADLDQFNPITHWTLGYALFVLHQYPAALEAMDRALSLSPNDVLLRNGRGTMSLQTGDLDGARTQCLTTPRTYAGRVCAAILFRRTGAVAEALAERAILERELGSSGAFQYLEIHAQWGELDIAMQWLATAISLNDSGLQSLTTDPLLDPLRIRPDFQALAKRYTYMRP